MKRLLNFLRGLWSKVTVEEPPAIVPEAPVEPIKPLPSIRDIKSTSLAEHYGVNEAGFSFEGMHDYSVEELNLLGTLIGTPDFASQVCTSWDKDLTTMTFKVFDGLGPDVEVQVLLKSGILPVNQPVEAGFIGVVVKLSIPRVYWILFSTPYTVFLMEHLTGKPSLAAIVNQVRKFITDALTPEENCTYKIEKVSCGKTIFRSSADDFSQGTFNFDREISARCMTPTGKEYAFGEIRQ